MKSLRVLGLGCLGMLAAMLLSACGDSSAGATYQTYTDPQYGFAVAIPNQVHKVATPNQPTNDPKAVYVTFRSNDNTMLLNLTATSGQVTVQAFCPTGTNVFVGKIPAHETVINDTQATPSPSATGTVAPAPATTPTSAATATTASAQDVSTVEFISAGVGYSMQLTTPYTGAASVQNHNLIWQHMLDSFRPGKGSNVGPQQCPTS